MDSKARIPVADVQRRGYGRSAMANKTVTKPLALSNITIKRGGEVMLAVTGDFHCGPKAAIVTDADGKSRIPVKYELAVTCAPSLDNRGFLFDQAQVDVWMQKVSNVPTKLSCEALVIELANRFMVKVATDTPCKIIGLRFTLSPAPFAAGVTARFGKVYD